MFDKITNGPARLKASQGIVRAAMATRESKAHKASRVELNNFVFQSSRNFNSRPRLVAPAHRTVPMVEFLSMVCAAVWQRPTNGNDAVCNS